MEDDSGVEHFINQQMATVMGPITGMEMVMAMVAMVTVATATVMVAMVVETEDKINT